MAIQDTSEFLDNYVKLMTAAWSDRSAEKALELDPTAYAAAAGLPIEAGATVVLDRSATDGLIPQEVLIADWTADSSAPILHVPVATTVDLAELTEGELEQVSGGFTIVIACFVAA